MRVALVAKAEIPVPGRGHNRRCLVAEVRDAERGAVRAQESVHVVGQPGFMAKLERGPNVFRHDRQKRREPLHVALEVRRQLKEQRTEMGPQKPRAVAEEIQRVAAGVDPEARVVRDPARRLERVGERRWRLIVPGRRGLGRGHPVERVVDLDRVKPRRVKPEHLRRREALRVEMPSPFRIVVPRRADVDVHDGLAPQCRPKRGRLATTTVAGAGNRNG